MLAFGVGEPDFDTPPHVIEAAQRALADGATRYTSVRGLLSLREAICDDSALRRGGVRHTPDEVVVSVGAKHSLFNLCLALLSPGDEAIVPTPCWVSYPEQCELVGAVPVLVATAAEDGFKLTADALARVVTGRTRALFLCSPCNPTGSAYTADELRAFAEVARSHDFWIIVDEIYAALVYDGFEQRSLLEVAPELRDRVIIVDGVSKRFAMTGFRVGWILAPGQVAAACETLQSQTTSSAATVSQYAALAALTGPCDSVVQMRRAFEQRRNLTVAGLNAMPGLQCRTPEGAFYAFFDVRGLYGQRFGGRTVVDDVSVVELLLECAHCGLVPGSAFFAPGYVRMSYAASEEALREGLARMARVLGT